MAPLLQPLQNLPKSRLVNPIGKAFRPSRASPFRQHSHSTSRGRTNNDLELFPRIPISPHPWSFSIGNYQPSILGQSRPHAHTTPHSRGRTPRAHREKVEMGPVYAGRTGAEHLVGTLIRPTTSSERSTKIFTRI